jgi:hypothetical protein
MTDIEKAEYDDVVRKLTTKLEQLAAENASLRSADGAIDVLRNIYRDESAPRSDRIKAANGAIAYEQAKILPQPMPMTLVANDPDDEQNLPLAELVEKRRARAHRMWREDPQFQGLRNSGYLPKGDGNGSAGDGSDDTAG